ncbi:MAG: hypothetical protein IJK56_10295 [Firmicutes bacterium]|nr:hypothetical protein [Bacillota bacterium]
MKRRIDDGFTFIAIAYGANAETTNFEQANYFWVFSLYNGKVRKKELMSIFPKNSEERIDMLKGSIIDVMICRNFGPKAMAELHKRDISLYTFDGGCHAALRGFMQGKLTEL